MSKLNNETCLKCKYQIKQITISREKMLQLRKMSFEKCGSSFETLNLTFYAK